MRKEAIENTPCGPMPASFGCHLEWSAPPHRCHVGSPKQPKSPPGGAQVAIKTIFEIGKKEKWSVVPRGREKARVLPRPVGPIYLLDLDFCFLRWLTVYLDQ